MKLRRDSFSSSLAALATCTGRLGMKLQQDSFSSKYAYLFFQQCAITDELHAAGIVIFRRREPERQAEFLLVQSSDGGMG